MGNIQEFGIALARMAVTDGRGVYDIYKANAEDSGDSVGGALVALSIVFVFLYIITDFTIHVRLTFLTLGLLIFSISLLPYYKHWQTKKALRNSRLKDLESYCK